MRLQQREPRTRDVGNAVFRCSIPSARQRRHARYLSGVQNQIDKLQLGQAFGGVVAPAGRLRVEFVN